MIKTVIFDLGNVILPFDLTRLTTRLAKHSSFTPTEIIQRLWNQDLAHRFETGEMNEIEYYDYVTESCGLKNLPFHDFSAIFNDIFKEDQEIADLLHELSQKVRLGMISNTNPIHAAHIRKTYDKLALFEKVWFSNEHGVRKPDPAIYRRAIDHFGHEPSHMVFIDDLEENIFSARSLGIKGIHFTGAPALKKALADFEIMDSPKSV